jgi:hypothetical protein
VSTTNAQTNLEEEEETLECDLTWDELTAMALEEIMAKAQTNPAQALSDLNMIANTW